jgi:hypothetical protein
MKKKLKIKFWKAEKALAMQIVEQDGLPKEKSDGYIRIAVGTDIDYENLYLRGDNSLFDFDVNLGKFDYNKERDEWLNKITQAITDELFTEQGELKVGEKCEFRLDEYCPWSKHKLLAILPEKYNKRYIASLGNYNWVGFREARPICKRTEPKVETNGEIITYTWEEEIKNLRKLESKIQ